MAAKEKYKDPENVDEIIAELKNCPTVGDIYELINRVFPGWFVGSLPGYSDDYSFMERSWETVCKKSGQTKKELIIVEYVSDKIGYKLTETFSEILTIVGFCVRQKKEYFACDVCGKGLPQPQLYDLLKKGMYGPSLPLRWSKICSTC